MLTPRSGSISARARRNSAQRVTSCPTPTPTKRHAASCGQTMHQKPMPAETFFGSSADPRVNRPAPAQLHAVEEASILTRSVQDGWADPTTSTTSTPCHIRRLGSICARCSSSRALHESPEAIGLNTRLCGCNSMATVMPASQARASISFRYIPPASRRRREPGVDGDVRVGIEPAAVDLHRRQGEVTQAVQPLLGVLSCRHAVY
jgi:hypothetical protein